MSAPARRPRAGTRAPAIPGATSNRVGTEGRLFADLRPGADETSFQVDNTSEAYYKSPYYKEHREQLRQIPLPRELPSHLRLVDVIGQAAIAPCLSAQRISFHAVGDTGPSSEARIGSEAGVADAMSGDLAAASGASSPAFLFHLGDVVYSFGEPRYYYDQFYEPFRNYDAPIFAIPGNHDGFTEEGEETLFAFLRNFCASVPGPSPDSGGLVRSAMTQPGVYFTLEAPFVSIIGVYSNVLEGPGVISSEGGVYPIGDQQREFLTSELQRLKPERERRERAIVLACHHPPLSLDSKHGGTRGLAIDIDHASEAAGIRPDVILSGHAHLYQRFTRSIDGQDIPYIVAGSGGHGLTGAQTLREDATPPTGYSLTTPPILEYGYLTVTVDMAASPPTLTVSFTATRPAPAQADSVTLDLAGRRIVDG